MEIPWQNPAAMTEIKLYFSILERNRPHAFEEIRDRSRRIDGIISELDPLLGKLCRLTCPDCQDNCCERATIWYDFKDLLRLYSGSGSFPSRQISRKEGLYGVVCCHLSEMGCILPRVNRPFVCTWYICPAQKSQAGFPKVQEQMVQVKKLRDEMETLFAKAS